MKKTIFFFFCYTGESNSHTLTNTVMSLATAGDRKKTFTETVIVPFFGLTLKDALVHQAVRLPLLAFSAYAI